MVTATFAPSQGALTLPPLVRPSPTSGSAGRSLRLGGTDFRVCSFETHRPGEAPSAPLRTVGWTSLQLTPGPLAASAPEAVRVCLESVPPSVSREAARDKVVLCDRDGRTAVYQADREKQAASLAACGNASGAAAAMFAQLLGRRRFALELTLPEGGVQMHAQVSREGGGGWLVQQRWGGVQAAMRPADLVGRQVAVCTGTLNDYLLVRLSDAAAIEAFGVEQALELWHAAQGRFGFQDLLRCRLAAVAADEAVPAVRFFTCGRMHPGAPLTGLALLSLAAREIDWLAPLGRAGKVQHRRGTDALPGANVEGGVAEIELSPVTVVLRDS